MQLNYNTKEQLSTYCTLIVKWNKAYNLLAASQSEDQLWQRHIEDSIQLFELIPADINAVIDLGSGAGFPAIPLAILSKDAGRNTRFHLVESVGKKATFLSETARQLKLDNVIIQNQRIENAAGVKADIITARAFAKISEIFTICKNFTTQDTKFILLKGKNLPEEISEAQKRFSFDYQQINSKTGDGFIFLAENLKEK